MVSSLPPSSVSFRFSTTVSTGTPSVLVIPAPRQTISSSNINQPFLAVSVLLNPLSDIPDTLYKLSIFALPTQS